MATRSAAAKIDEKSSTELPPARKEKKGIRHDVPLPLEHTSLSTVVYWLTGGSLLFLAYYGYLVTQWKTDAGGWLNLALGRKTPAGTEAPFGSAGAKYESETPGAGVEDRIKELAELLGIHPKEFASAIKPLIPPAKATAIENDNEASGTLVDVLTGSATAPGEAEPTGFGLGSIVGLDEPPNEIS